MPNPIAKQDAGALAPRSIYDVLGELARDPTVDVARIAALMDLQIKAEDRNAEKEFNAAFARLKFPPIKKTAKGQGTTKYAPLDEVQAIVNPILAGEGFTFTFSTGGPDDKGQVRMIGDLIHVGGHSKPYGLTLPAEKTGQMNNTQAVVSATSYGMRALYKMAFSLEFVGEDDDARSISFISEREVMTIMDMFQAAEMGADRQAKFLEFMNAKAVSEIHVRDYAKAMNQLQAAVRKAQKK